MENECINIKSFIIFSCFLFSVCRTSFCVLIFILSSGDSYLPSLLLSLAGVYQFYYSFHRTNCLVLLIFSMIHLLSVSLNLLFFILCLFVSFPPLFSVLRFLSSVLLSFLYFVRLNFSFPSF